MANSPQVNINLIGKPKMDFGANFVKWTFNVGKVVIAVTELVVLLALAYRFYIDRQIIDLHDKIEDARGYVESQEPKEKNYLSIQNRLANIKEVEENTEEKISIMNKILTYIDSGDFSSTNLTIDQNNVRLEGIAFSIFPINLFIKDLKDDPNVTSISLDDFSSTSDGIRFKLSIELANDI